MILTNTLHEMTDADLRKKWEGAQWVLDQCDEPDDRHAAAVTQIEVEREWKRRESLSEKGAVNQTTESHSEKPYPIRIPTGK